MRVIITGSRVWADSKPIYEALVKLPPDAIIVHGAARGADQLAEVEAQALGLRTEGHPADWERYGRRAGPIRNQAMLDLGADLVLAFPMPSSIGTWDMVQRAQSVGVPVEVCKAGLP